jgi:hypothetical protein
MESDGEGSRSGERNNWQVSPDGKQGEALSGITSRDQVVFLVFYVVRREEGKSRCKLFSPLHG